MLGSRAAYAHGELGHACRAELVGHSIRRRERVAYEASGNRVVAPREVLRRIEPLLARCGITRVADISRLTYEEFPVFQSCRPSIWGHHAGGQNTGSQGKGATSDQAKVSCIMESIEGYCAEPRLVNLYRGSYERLRGHQVVVDPRRFVRLRGAPELAPTDPIMWTEGYSLALGRSVLVPAEAVFFPFSPGEYHTRSFFPCWTNGLASGSTMLEAITHGLYEVIERYFIALYEAGLADSYEVGLSDERFVTPHVRRFIESSRDTLKSSVFLLKVPRREQLVTIAICQMLHVFTTRGAEGSGCSSLPSVAIERAISEAAQSLTVDASGAREDMERMKLRQESAGRAARRKESAAQKARGRHATYFPAMHRFSDLREELRFLVREIHTLGFPDVFIANLTRVGIDVPVVKVLVPEMSVPDEISEQRSAKPGSRGRLTRLRFGISDEEGLAE